MTKDDLSMHIHEDGAIEIYTIIDGEYRFCKYYGYSEREARNKFYKEYVKGE